MNPLSEHLARFDYAAVPLRRSPTGHLQLDGAINGVAAALYLDTGAGRTVLDTDGARRRGLELRETGRGAGLGTAAMTTYATTIRHLNLQAVEAFDLAVTAIDLSHVNAGLRARGAAPMDGVIGADLLETHEAIIDYKRLHLYLKRTPAPGRPNP